MNIKQQKKELQKRVRQITKELKKHELFGTQEIIKIHHEIEFLSEKLKSSSKCNECNGKGETYHDCDCDLCEFNGDWVECNDCLGDGVL